MSTSSASPAPHSPPAFDHDEATLALLAEAARRAARYLAGRDVRPVFPTPASLANLAAFDEPLPDAPQDALGTLALLDDVGSPATVTSTGGRYFGFVFGGTLPAPLAANWLAGAWDQNAAMVAASLSHRAASVPLVRSAMMLPSN